MNFRSLIVGITTGIILSMIMAFGLEQFFAVADQNGEVISKENTLHMSFDDANPEGSVDLKKIVEEDLNRPEECNQQMIYCQIQSVYFDITIRKEWFKMDIRALNNQEFASTIPRLQNDINNLSDPEIVVMQEALARRGLLRHLDGSLVYERGFFGPLTWLSLVKLAQIKGLNDGDPEFGKKLTEAVNRLLDNMATDDNYVNNRTLPSEENMTPQDGDELFDLWTEKLYLAQLAQNADLVEKGVIPLDNNNDVNIDGYVNVERVD